MNMPGQESEQRLDNRVLPAMREAVATVQLVLFAALKNKFAGRYSERETTDFRLLAGCVVSDLFAQPPDDPAATRFASAHRDLIETELRGLAAEISDLLPLLTDALRMQVLCDQQQGLNSLPTLLRAKALGILLEDRDLPLPSTFMLAVRRLGVDHGLLAPLAATGPAAD